MERRREERRVEGMREEREGERRGIVEGRRGEGECEKGERRGEREVVMRGVQTYSRPVSYKHVPGAP